VPRTLFDTTVCDHPGIAAEKMGNKENVALQAINPRIINDLTRKKENVKSRRGQDGDLRSLVLQLYFYKSLPKVATPWTTIRLLSKIPLGVSA
jgi:hypothetical protein